MNEILSLEAFDIQRVTEMDESFLKVDEEEEVEGHSDHEYRRPKFSLLMQTSSMLM